jgi:hypothetical protein
VLDSGGVSVDYLLIADINGLMKFSGGYEFPPLSYKIEDYWFSLTQQDFEFVQIVNDTLSKRVWMTQPNNRQQILMMDYNEGMTHQSVKWARWIYDAQVSTLCLINVNQLIIGTLT